MTVNQADENIRAQHRLLNQVDNWIDKRRFKMTASDVMTPINAENLRSFPMIANSICIPHADLI